MFDTSYRRDDAQPLDALRDEWEHATRAEIFFQHGRTWNDEEWQTHGEYDADVVLAVLDELPWKTGRQRALDFGCGDGRVGKFLRRSCAGGFTTVVGVDLRAPGADVARRTDAWNPRDVLDEYVVVGEPRSTAEHRAPESPRPPIWIDDIAVALDEAVDCAGGQFDLVYSLLTLQHNPPDVAEWIIASLIDVLAPGGVLFFDVRDHKEKGVVPSVRRMFRPVATLARRLRGPRGAPKAVYELDEQSVERLVKRTSAYIHSVHRDASSSRTVARYIYVVVRPKHDSIPTKENEPRHDPLLGDLSQPNVQIGAEVLRALAGSRGWIQRRDSSVRFVDDVVIAHKMRISVSRGAYARVAGRVEHGKAPDCPDSPPALLPLALLSKNLLTDIDVTDADGTHVTWLIRRYNNWVAWSVLAVAARNVLGEDLKDEVRDRLAAVAYSDHRRARAILRTLREESDGPRAWQDDLRRLLADEYFEKLLFDLAYNWILLVQINDSDAAAEQFEISYVECLEWNPWHDLKRYRNKFSTFYGGPFTLLDRSRSLQERRRVVWQCIQSVVGWVPIRVVLAAPSFADSQSYHFTPDAPPGLKLVGARLHARTVDGRRWIWHGAAGGQKAHVYAKPRAWSFAGKVELELVPRPRGATRHAMFAAIASALILSGAYFFLPNVLNDIDSQAQTAVALLVALPGAIAALLARPDDHETSAALNPGVKGLIGLVALVHLSAGLTLLGHSTGWILAAWTALTALAWVFAFALVAAYTEPLRTMRRASRRRTASPTAANPMRCRCCGRRVALKHLDEDVLDDQDFAGAFASETFLFLAPSAEGQRAGFRHARTVPDATEAAARTAGLPLDVSERQPDDLGSAYPYGSEVCHREGAPLRPDRAPLEHSPQLGSTEHTMRWIVLAGFWGIADHTVRGVYGYGFSPFDGRPRLPLVILWIAMAVIAASYARWRLVQREQAIDSVRSFRHEPDKRDSDVKYELNPRLRWLIRYRSQADRISDEINSLRPHDCRIAVVDEPQASSATSRGDFADVVLPAND